MKLCRVRDIAESQHYFIMTFFFVFDNSDNCGGFITDIMYECVRKGLKNTLLGEQVIQMGLAEKYTGAQQSCDPVYLSRTCREDK